MVRLNRTAIRARATMADRAWSMDRAWPRTITRMAAIGEVDELNSAIGVPPRLRLAMSDQAARRYCSPCRTTCSISALTSLRRRAVDFAPRKWCCASCRTQVERLERAIDALNERYRRRSRSFILLGGSPAAARVPSRPRHSPSGRAGGVTAAGATPINPAALAYLNRLSDLLFVLARRSMRMGGDIL